MQWWYVMVQPRNKVREPFIYKFTHDWHTAVNEVDILIDAGHDAWLRGSGS